MGLVGDVEDGELPRFEAEEVDHQEEVDDKSVGTCKSVL